MRSLILALTVLLGTVSGTVLQPSFAIASAPAALPPTFSTESAAQVHCPHDTVVWLNIPTGIYHMKGERWYGKTKHGAYVCQKEANAAGDRETENGQ